VSAYNFVGILRFNRKERRANIFSPLSGQVCSEIMSLATYVISVEMFSHTAGVTLTFITSNVLKLSIF